MFGSRLKTWMENYIGRPRKKEAQKEKAKGSDGGGVVLESSESLACSDTGVSFGSRQVLSSSATDNREGYSTTTMESEKSGMTHCHTAVSLPSPESAYSTGYSTDGASPGESGPPEYYINIRTGKHYFPSPAPTPTSPRPGAAFARPRSPDRRLPGPPASLLPRGRLPASPGRSGGLPPPLGSLAPDSSPSRNASPAAAAGARESSAFSKSPREKSSPASHLAPVKLFLKSPRREKGKPKADPGRSPATPGDKKRDSSGKPKKWFRQPFQKFGHRRTDSCDEGAARIEPKKEIRPEKNFPYRLGGESAASPLQRNRIKTNPWLPTEPPSSRALALGFSPALARNRSCGNTPLQDRKAGPPRTESGPDRPRRPGGKNEEAADRAGKFEKAASRQKCGTEASDRSEEDLTLNEVMGTCDESYVYEKETDILSDSDPTDCEDYGTDSEADNGGDERDSHDDELDFIDDGGSLLDGDLGLLPNTGRCTYHDVRAKRNSFARKGDRRKFKKESEGRKNSRKDQDSKARRDRRRQTRKSFGREDDDDGKRLFEENLRSRALAQRASGRSASKSAEGTPATARRHAPTGALAPARCGSDKWPSGGGSEGRRATAVLVDFEADHKYDRLMKEAETILESVRNGQAVASAKDVRGREAPRKTPGNPGTADPRKKTGAESSPRGGREEPSTPARRSPRVLGLDLSAETPKKPKRLDLETNGRGSFRTRSSAHSPLDPLGPALRHFAVFGPALRDDGKPSPSSSDDSETDNAPAAEERAGRRCGLPPSPAVPVAFRSLDLGKAPAPHCPQSEPVKRKIYSCSKTYDRLVKRFENEPAAFCETEGGKVGSSGDRDAGPRLDGNQGFFPDERRKDGPAVPRGGILRRAPLAPAPPRGPDDPRGRSSRSDVFR